MEKLVLYLQRIENDKLTAEVHVQINKGQVTYTVVSNSYDIKTHLTSLLGSNYFIVLPSTLLNSKNYVFSVKLANTKQHLLYLYDYLSWRGYKVINTEIVETKSFIDFFEDQALENVNKSFIGSYNEQENEQDTYELYKIYGVTKSVGGAMNFSEYVRTDKNGTRILVRVPPGFLAVNSKENKILSGGKFLNVNLDDILEGKSDWSLIPTKLGEKEIELLGGQKKVNFLLYIAKFISELQENLPETPKTEKEKEDYEEISKKSLEELVQALKKKFPDYSVEKVAAVLKVTAEKLKDYISALFTEKAETIEEESGVDQAKNKELFKQLDNIVAYSPSTGIYTTALESLRASDVTDWIYIKDSFSSTSIDKKKNALLRFLQKFGINPEAPKNWAYVEFVKAIFDDPKSLESSAILHRFKNDIGNLILPITVLPVIHGMQIEIPEEFIIDDATLLNSKGNLFGFYIPKPDMMYTADNAYKRKPNEQPTQDYYFPEMSVDQASLGTKVTLKELIDAAKEKLGPVVKKKVKPYKDPAEFVGTTQNEIVALQQSKDSEYQSKLYKMFFDPKTGKARTDLNEILKQLSIKSKSKSPQLKEFFELVTDALFGVKIDLNSILAKGFKPKPYQLYGALLAMNPASFRHSGGLRSKLGFNYFWATGVGKTITALLALELGKYTGVYDGAEEDKKKAEKLRNRPVLIIAPKNLAGNWVNDARDALGWERVVISRDPKTNKLSITGSGVLVIDGKASERKEIYEFLLDLHKSGNFPQNIKAIVVGTQKFSFKAGEAEDFDEIKNIDLKYLNYLAGPTRYYDSQGKPVDTDFGFFRAVVVDEAGQIMNETSSRAANIYGIVSRVTSDSNKGICINLNAESLSNTPSDTINVLRLTDTYGTGLKLLPNMLKGTGKIQTYGEKFLERTSHLFSDLSQSDVIDLDAYRELVHRAKSDEILDFPSAVYPAFAVFDTYAKLYDMAFTSNQPIKVFFSNHAIHGEDFLPKTILNNYRPAFTSMLMEMHYGALPWKRFLEYGYDVLPSVVDPSQSKPITLSQVYEKAKELYTKASSRTSAASLSQRKLEDFLDEAKRILYKEKLKEISIKTAILSNNADFIEALDITEEELDSYKKKYSSQPPDKFIPLRDAVKMASLDAIKFIKKLFAGKSPYIDAPNFSDQTFYQEYDRIYEEIIEKIRFDGIGAGKIYLNNLEIYLPNFDKGKTGVYTPEEGELEVNVEQSLGVAADKDATGSERKLFIQKRDELLNYGILLSALHAAGILKLDRFNPIDVHIKGSGGTESNAPEINLTARLADGSTLSLEDIKERFREELSYLNEAISMALDDTIYSGKAFRETMEGFLSGIKRNGAKFNPNTGKIDLKGGTSSKFRFLSIGNSRKYIEALDRLFGGLDSTYKGALVGGLSHETQQNMAKAHVDSSVSVILGTTDAAGRGLNLNSEEAVVVADYGYETTQQTIGRAFRAGSADSSKPPKNKTRINVLYPAATIDILTFKQLQGAYLELSKVEKMLEATDPNSADHQFLRQAASTIEKLYQDGSDISSLLRSEVYLARYAHHISSSGLSNLINTIKQHNPSKFDLLKALTNIQNYGRQYAGTASLSNISRFLQRVKQTVQGLAQTNEKVAQILKEFFRDV